MHWNVWGSQLDSSSLSCYRVKYFVPLISVGESWRAGRYLEEQTQRGLDASDNVVERKRNTELIVSCRNERLNVLNKLTYC